MTNQEAFTQALLGLRIQGVASITPAYDQYPPRCAYRNPKGLKCAAGMLIPDELYNTLTLDIENVGISDLATSNLNGEIRLRQLFDGVDVGLLQNLQDAHDFHLQKFGLESWELKMEDIAAAYGLAYKPLVTQPLPTV